MAAKPKTPAKPKAGEMVMGYMEIADYKAFGLLIAEYSLGYQLTSTGEQPAAAKRVPMPWPKTLDEFKEACRKRGVGKVLDNVKGIQMIQPSDDVLLLRLPPKRIINEAIALHKKAKTTNYPMPDFYETMLLAGKPRAKPEGMPHLDFWYCRVGDYTVSFCG